VVFSLPYILLLWQDNEHGKECTVSVDTNSEHLEQSFVLIVKLSSLFGILCKPVTTQFAYGFCVIERLTSTDKGEHFVLGIFPEQIVTSSVLSRSGNRQDGNGKKFLKIFKF
jgi:hypothetical protein